MNKTDILSALDEEISRLRQARDLLADASLPMRSASSAKTPSSTVSEPAVKRGPGRPKGSGSKAAPGAAKKKVGRPAGTSSKSTGAEAKEPGVKRRTMSPEGKARIAAAQRARWARQHGKAAAKSAGAKKSAGKTEASATLAGKTSPGKTGGATKAAKKAAPVKAAKTVKKAPVKARAPYKKSAKPAVDTTAQTSAGTAGE